MSLLSTVPILINRFKLALRMSANLHTPWLRPLRVAVNVTGRCNLLCEFCEKSVPGQRFQLGYSKLKQLVDLASRFGSTLFLAGGEPFLHRDIWNMLRYARDANVKVEINTNGTRLENLSDERMTLLRDSVSVMRVSIDSADPQEHDQIRGVKGSFAKTRDFLIDPRLRTPCELIAVLTPEFHRVRPLIDLAGELKIPLDFVPFIFETNFPGLSKPVAMKRQTKEMLHTMAERVGELEADFRYAESRGVHTNLRFILKYLKAYYRHADTKGYFQDFVLDKFMCVTTSQQITVDESGIILPCALKRGTVHIDDGDIYANWSKQAKDYRRAFKNGARFPECRSCSCHMSENFYGSLVAHPWKNRREVIWKLRQMW